MSSQDWVVLGRITAPYGIKGWVKLASFTEPEDNIASYDPIWIGRNGEWKQSSFRRFQDHGKGWVAQLDGCIDRNQSEAMVGIEIAVPRNHLPALPAGEYYWSDLEGLSVYNRQEQWLGVVARMMETGANDVMVVKPVQGSFDDQERLIAFVPDVYVLKVDLALRRIDVDWEADF